MDKTYKKFDLWVCVFLFVIIMLFPNKVIGASVGYTIKSYNIDVVVNENNSFDITETITTNFSQEKHGIIRKIPILNSIVRNDGSKAKNCAFITNIEANEKYTQNYSNGYISLKLGSSSHTLLGDYTYVIKYKYYILGTDGLENADEFYFNLIGTEWDTKIENVTFKITMPKEFDTSLLGFSSGYKGSKDSSNVQYSVNGNVITGSTKSPLKSGQGVTIRLTLPDEYFFNILIFLKKQYMNIILTICALCLLRAFILWFRHGKDENIVETVEFYPPQGYNSAEIGYIYNGKATDEAIISTLIQLANKGYIEIEEVETKNILKKKTFRITKLKEYSEKNEIEKSFFTGLFKQGKPDSRVVEDYIRKAEKKGEKVKKYQLDLFTKKLPIKVVTETDLKNQFYTTINSIKKYLENYFQFYTGRIYEENYDKKDNIKLMIKRICFLALCNVFIQSKANILYKILTVIVLQFSIPKLINTIFFCKRKYVGDIISLVIFTGISLYFVKNYIYPMMLQNIEVKKFYIFILVEILILVIFNILMRKRTRYGTKILGQIKGFRRFLENAEKEQLEALVEENPKYFYDILPYTYALGISKKWVEQFETIATTPPGWYNSSYNIFNANDFSDLFDGVMKDISNSMTYGAKEDYEPRVRTRRGNWWNFVGSSSDSSSYSSDCGSSGGGSSGGGSGGRWRKFVVDIK